MSANPSFNEQVQSFSNRVTAWRHYVNGIRDCPERMSMEVANAAEEMTAAQEELQRQNLEILAAQSLLEEERQRYHDLFEFAPDGYIVTDARGVVLEANRAALAMINLKSPLVTGSLLYRFIHSDDVRVSRHQIALLLQSGHANEWTARLVPRSAPSFHASIRVSAARSRFGAATSAIRWILRDATDRARMEIQLRTLAAEVAELRAQLAAAPPPAR
jgi:PAS domain S-box-containing protein